jgi:predicted deacetylase
MSRYLVVAMHDVTPATWPACSVLLSALDEVCPVPKSLLVIPNVHRGPTARSSERFCRVMTEHVEQGDELVLHGYTHLDDQPPGDFVDQLIRTRYTAGEGEFSAIPLHAARSRLEAGAAWFAANGWPLHGFVAPAWLMNAATWQVLDQLPLRYTTTLRRFHLLHPNRPLAAPCLTYSVRTTPRRLLSRHYLRWLAQQHAQSPLLRLGLHPSDAAYPDVIRHWQDLLAACLETRTPVTKNGFAQVCAQALMGGTEVALDGRAQASY